LEWKCWILGIVSPVVPIPRNEREGLKVGRLSGGPHDKFNEWPDSLLSERQGDSIASLGLD
jgi:hypothetical protein